jgi:predicted Fe-Mo cluster-binding NifX family protein
MNLEVHLKIAFTTSGIDPAAPLDGRFGRTPKFLVFDLDAGTFDVIDNAPGVNAAQGAGIQAAETVVRSGAQALVTGHCGPKAFRALKAAGVRIFTTDAATVAEALERYKSGKLAEADSADVEGHW